MVTTIKVLYYKYSTLSKNIFALIFFNTFICTFELFYHKFMAIYGLVYFIRLIL